MDFEVNRQNLHKIRLNDAPKAPLSPGQIRLKVEQFGLSANNITYAVMGDALHYWDIYPASDGQWGRIPVWGIAQVVESLSEGISVGVKVYGLLPMSTDFVVMPGKISKLDFFDLSPHRQSVSPVYNRYQWVDESPVFSGGNHEAKIVLLPLMTTAFLVDDLLAEDNYLGAKSVIISSASSKLAIGIAYALMQRGDIDVIGLTSPSQKDFVDGLGCYSKVLTYDQLQNLPAGKSVYVNIAGNHMIQSEVHQHYGDNLMLSLDVGITHFDKVSTENVTRVGPKPEFFFAPTHYIKLLKDLGADELNARLLAAGQTHLAWANKWLQIKRHVGATAIEELYLQLINNKTDPKAGYVCSF